MEEQKRCPKCNRSLPRNNDYFFNNRRAKDGFTCWCKDCMVAYQDTRKNEIKAYQKGYRKTHKKSYPRSEFARKNKQAYSKKRYYSTDPLVRKAKQKAYGQTPQGKFAEYRNCAKKRKLAFELSFEQFMEFWQQSCHFCGSDIQTIGIDRLDNSIGYIFQNCVPCCIVCNKMKFKMTSEEFTCHIRKIIAHLEECLQHVQRIHPDEFPCNMVQSMQNDGASRKKGA